MKEIDARGLACPAPVLQTRTEIETNNLTEVSVVVDNPAAEQNVVRFLRSRGFDAKTERREDVFRIIGVRGSEAPAHTSTDRKNERTKIMVVCASDRMGFGDDILGQKLMINFLRTLKEMGDELWRLVFVNNGVKLTIDGSEVLDDLKAYEADGIKILVCGTCLDFFKLLDRKQIGETTNMLDIVTAMQLADKVINL